MIVEILDESLINSKICLSHFRRFNDMLDEFDKHLQRGNLSQNTISAYLLSVRMYKQLGGEITKRNLLAFKGHLM